MTPVKITTIEKITDEGVLQLLINGVLFDLQDSERQRLGDIMKAYERAHEKRIRCQKCGSEQLYGVEEPPVPWGMDITVWKIRCDNCNEVVLVKSDY